MIGNITVNTQSSIRIAGEEILYFDPLDIPEKVSDADIVFITHDHYDHFSDEDIEKVKNDSTVFVVPRSMAEKALNYGLPADKLMSFDPGESTEILGIPVETVPMYNVNKKFHARSAGWLGYVVTVDGERIYVAGDIDAIDEAKNLKCDTAIVPIGGTYTMNAREAAQLINIMKPAAVIPVHYGSIVGSRKDGEDFAALVGEQTKVVFRH